MWVFLPNEPFELFDFIFMLFGFFKKERLSPILSSMLIFYIKPKIDDPFK
jgi:hypothetical protein